MREQLIRRIERREAVIGVVGLGYVGLPLLLEFNRQGFPTVGMDIDPEKVAALTSGHSYLLHIPDTVIAELTESGRFSGASTMEAAAKCDVLILCVPTPLTKNREPDTSYIENTGRAIAPHMKPGQLVVLESTTYPGTTEEILMPVLESGSGLKCGSEIFVAYSPEREDPNNPEFTTSKIPKVLGGCTPEGGEVAKALYDCVVVKTVMVSNARTAEATKLLENIFRSVNIAMVNELKIVFHRMGIDIWEVVDAAKTKPFGYMPFYPGPGLGGHCIPIDPFYLTWKAREYEIPTKFIELAGEINTSMPDYVITRTMEALNDAGKAMRGSRIMLIGLAYKANVDDIRESPSLKLMKLLTERGAEVLYHDPHVPVIKPTREYGVFEGRESVPASEAATCDAVVISTNHKAVDYAELGRLAPVIIDTRNAMNGIAGTTARVYKS